jgi:hypothetical protein
MRLTIPCSDYLPDIDSWPMGYKHKYGAQKCEADGIKFPSKLERNCYQALKRLQNDGKVLFFLRQIPFDLPGNLIHRIDFQVFLPDDVLFIESKGRDLPIGKMKRLQVEDLYKVKVHIATKPSDIIDIILQQG